MSSKAEVIIYFPMGASFISNPELVFYNGYIQFLKKLYCINTDNACRHCPFSAQCRFFQYTGQYFEKYSGIIMHSSYFTKKRYAKNDELALTLYYIGSCEKIADSCLLFVRDYLNQRIGGHFFCIKHLCITEMEESRLEGNELSILSPVDSTDLRQLIRQMAEYYNQHYDTHLPVPEGELKSGALSYQKRTGYRICGRYISLNGYIGKVTGQIWNIPSIFAESGIGRSNCIGGGEIEIKNIAS